MVSHIIAPAEGATQETCVTIERDRRPLRPDEPEKYNTFLNDQPLVIRHHAAMYESCRALLTRGITGRAVFKDATTGAVRMTMDIVKCSGLTLVENDEGLRVRKYVPFPTGSVENGRKPAPAMDTPQRQVREELA